MNSWLVTKEELPEGVVQFSELMCGCGQPILCWEELHKFLKKHTSKEPYENTEEPLRLFFYYVINHLGFTEHGTSIYGAWATEKGKEVLAWLEKNIDKVEDLVITY